jgi:hypothetical protein
MKRHPCIKSSFANYVLKPLCPVVKPVFKVVFKIEVYIDGTDKVMPRGKSFPKPGAKIRVFIGKPKDYSHEKNYKEVAIKIMEEIKALSHF